MSLPKHPRSRRHLHFCIGSLPIASVLIASLGLMLAGRVTAQTFTTIHHFILGEGANAQASLILSGNILYGTASKGGITDYGTIFKLNTDGTGFTNLHKFTGSEGANPV